MIKILIIILLIIIVNYLYKKNQYDNEYFSSLLTTAINKYNTNNVLVGNTLRVNPANPMSIQNDLSANIIYASDISANNISTLNLPINSNNTYNKLTLNTNVIEQIKNPIIQSFNGYNKKNNYMYDPDLTHIYNDIATNKTTSIDISGYTTGHDVSGWFGTLTIDSSGFNTGFVLDVLSSTNKYTYDWEHYGNSIWGGQYIHQIVPYTNKRGIRLAIPVGCNVLWLGLLSYTEENRYTYFSICDINNKCYGIYGAGRNLNSNITPGGYITNKPYDSWITWVQIPLYWLDTTLTNNNVILNCYLSYMSNNGFASSNHTHWISSCAFSSNPWNHCNLSAAAIYDNMNSIERIPPNKLYANFFSIWSTIIANSTWFSDSFSNYNGSNIFYINQIKSSVIRMPIIKSGKDKFLYIIALNRRLDTEAIQISLVDANLNLIKLPPLKTTYSNPFSRHFNSRIENIYRATIIQDAQIIPDSYNRTFITINIFSPHGNSLWIKEIGTHDVN
jgi:hypothetical protein